MWLSVKALSSVPSTEEERKGEEGKEGTCLLIT